MLLGAVVLLLLLLLIIVLLMLLLLLLPITVTSPIAIRVCWHHVVGIINIATTTATCCIYRIVRMGVLIGLQLYPGSTPKVRIRFFLLPVSVGGFAPGCGRSLLLVAVTIASLSTIVRRHRI